MKALTFRLAGTGLALALAVALASPAGAGEVLDRVMKTKTLTMSSDPAYPPQSFLNDKNEFEGFDIDVGREIAKRMGAELKVVTPAWEVITAGNWGQRWDISVGSMTPTSERAHVLDFPAIYYFTPASFAVHKDSKAQKIEDLNGKVIGVCGGCTYESYLKKELKIDAEGVPPFEYKVEPKEIRTYETDTNALDDLRLLSNLDFDRTPPFALLLVGQPPLRDTLAQPELASLQQRLAIHAALSPLTEQEAADYLDRRMREPDHLHRWRRRRSALSRLSDRSAG